VAFGHQSNPFYQVYPAFNITANSFPLNSTSIDIGALLILSISTDPSRQIVGGFSDIANLECQRAIINANPTLLPDTTINILYYDTGFFNTSRATISALEFSLDKTHIATLGPNSADLLLPMVEYFESLRISNYNPRFLSSTFSSPINFSNLRTVTQSDAYVIKSYMQLMSFFGWSWVAAGFGDDDIGQTGRYTFAELANVDVFFPCYIIVGVLGNLGLGSLADCLRKYPDVKVLLLWGSSGSVFNVIRYLYEETDIDYLTFVVNTQAAKEFPKIAGKVPESFYRGMIFLDINYDPEPYEQCMEEVFSPNSILEPWMQKYAEMEYECVFDISGASTLSECTGDRSKNNHQCRCSTAMLQAEKRPYSSVPTLYRDILTGYAIGLHTIKYNCTTLMGNFCDLDSITGLQLISAMDQVPYIGYSGFISFNETFLNNRINGTLDVYQLVPVNETKSDLTVPGIVLIGYMIPASLQSYSGIYLDQNQFRFNTGGDSVPISGKIFDAS